MLTIEAFDEGDILVAAVPDSTKFRQLAEAWRQRPLVRKTGIQIALVGREGWVEGIGV